MDLSPENYLDGLRMVQVVIGAKLTIFNLNVDIDIPDELIPPNPQGQKE